MVGIAHRPAGADAYALDHPVDPEVTQRQAPGPAGVRREKTRELLQQPAAGEGDIVRAADRLGEGDAGAKAGRGAAWGDGLEHPVQGLIQALEKGAGEAAGEGRARQPVEVPDPAQAQPVEGRCRGRIEPQARDRQVRERLACATGRDDGGGLNAMARRRPGRPRRIGDGGAGAEAQGPDAAQQLIEQRLLAAEEMGAAGDVQPQAVPAVRRREGGIALAPVGKRGERPGVGPWIERQHA